MYYTLIIHKNKKKCKYTYVDQMHMYYTLFSMWPYSVIHTVCKTYSDTVCQCVTLTH